jgi:hypothetical protein
MARLIGNYSITSEKGADSQPAQEEKKPETTVTEFERRAMERLGGSIAFVMKGKTVIWTGSDSQVDGTPKR